MTDIVQGIEYAVQEHPGSVWVGHAYVQDEVTGTPFILVEQGASQEDLKARVEGMLREMAGHVHDETGLDARLVGKGWLPRV